MAQNCIIIEHQENGVSYLTLNRPEKHNALNEQLIVEFQEHLVELDKHTDTRVIVLRGEGKTLCAGADLDFMKKMIHLPSEQNIAQAEELAHLFQTLASLSKPTICLAKGAIKGGGVGLLCCCDIVIAEESTNFCFPETKVGIIPSTIAPYVLHALGFRTTQYLYLTAKVFDVFEAEKYGLIHEIVPNGNLQESANKYIEMLLANGPNALVHAKKWLKKLMSWNEDTIKESAELIAKIRVSPEAQEGLQAFFEKRKPSWAKQ